jgi:hypothetical protein
MLITRLLGVSLLSPFLLGEALMGLLLRFASSPRFFPGSIFQFALFPDLAALIP